jgi:hypothetical protein
MTAIVSSAYVATYAQTGATAGYAGQAATTTGGNSQAYAPATNVTLSDAAKAALAADERKAAADAADTVRSSLDALLDSLGRTSPLDGGKLAVDLSAFSREEIFEIVADNGNKFTGEEQEAARLDLQRRFDDALRGGHAVTLVTGSFVDLYESALDYMEGAGPAERSTAEWQVQVSALRQVFSAVETNPGNRPEAIANDPVDEYLSRKEAGTDEAPDIGENAAANARAVLDRIYGAKGGLEELSGFGSRSLSAIALNRSQQFSSSEIVAARNEMKSRVGDAVRNAFQGASASGDPTAFSKRLIAQYSAMSAEEREAAGLDQGYYEAINQNYEISLRISRAFGQPGTAGGTSLLNFL